MFLLSINVTTYRQPLIVWSVVCVGAIFHLEINFSSTYSKVVTPSQLMLLGNQVGRRAEEKGDVINNDGKTFIIGIIYIILAEQVSY